MDLFHYLIQQSESASKSTSDASTKSTDQDLIYDSELAIVAGSDTTAATISAILFLLAQNRECLTRLREEIVALRSTVSAGPASHSSLAALPYLNGCINEGLRLYPAVMSGTQRQTGPHGAVIAGRSIPPDTLVSTPTYTLHRGTFFLFFKLYTVHLAIEQVMLTAFSIALLYRSSQLCPSRSFHPREVVESAGTGLASRSIRPLLEGTVCLCRQVHCSHGDAHAPCYPH